MSRRADPRIALALVAVGIALGFGVVRLLTGVGAPEKPAVDRMRDGGELLAVFIGSSTCGAAQYPGLKDALEDIRAHLKERAEVEGDRFVFAGVAVDRRPEVGVQFLEPFGPFDEVIAGGGWMNTASLAYVVRDFPSQMALPQLVLLERRVNLESSHVEAVSDRLVGRKVGSSAIVTYAQSLTSSPPSI